MLHILCKRCKSWIPRKRGKRAFSYSFFETKITAKNIRQIKCFCGRWTHDPRSAKFIGTREQIEAIKQNVKK